MMKVHIADTRVQDAEIEGEGVGEETNTTSYSGGEEYDNNPQQAVPKI